MGNAEIATELKAAILYMDHDGDPVKEIARLMGLSRRTIYDYLDGKIKISLPFLHAATIATNGHPAIGRFLEPSGFRLVRDEAADPQKHAEAELTDVVLAVGRTIEHVRSALEDKRLTAQERADLDLCLDDTERELSEARAAIRQL